MPGTENEPVINAVSASPAGYLYEYASHVSARVHRSNLEARSSNGYGSFKRASSPHPAVSFIIIHRIHSAIAIRVKRSYYALVPTPMCMNRILVFVRESCTTDAQQVEVC